MKPNTYFIDIDGCIFKHWDKGAAHQWLGGDVEVLPGTREYLNDLEREGHHIVLVTARPEIMRLRLEQLLDAFEIIRHQLVMGVTSGTRVLINDTKPSGPGLAAVAIEVERNAGLGSIS